MKSPFCKPASDLVNFGFGRPAIRVSLSAVTANGASVIVSVPHAREPDP